MGKAHPIYMDESNTGVFQQNNGNVEYLSEIFFSRDYLYLQ